MWATLRQIWKYWDYLKNRQSGTDVLQKRKLLNAVP